MKKKKVNLPLIEVLVGSLLLHIVAGVIAGGFVLYQSLQEPEPEFVPPPEIKRIQPERLEYKVKMKQQQKKSAKPRMKRIQVESPTNISVPQIDIVAPSVSSQVAVGTGFGGGSGSGNGLGAGGGLGLGKVSVDFFGLKGKGEKIVFIVDASEFMLLDDKGGVPVYEIVKAELVKLVGRIPPGTLYNVILYNRTGSPINPFKPKLVAASAASAQEVADWLAPVHDGEFNPYTNRGTSFALSKNFEPIGKDYELWVGAVHAAMEMQADTIFNLVSQFGIHHVRMGSQQEKLQWLIDNKGWSMEQEEQWQVLMDEARAWLAANQPDRVVDWMGTVVQELHPDVKTRPGLHYHVSDIVDYLKQVSKHYYKDRGNRPPKVHFVHFVGKDDPDYYWYATQTGTAKRKRGEWLKEVARTFKGRMREVEGLAGIKRVTKSNGTSVASTL